MGKRFKLNQVDETIPLLSAGALKAAKILRQKKYLLLVINCWSTNKGTQFNKVCTLSEAKEGNSITFLLSDRSIHFGHLVFSIPPTLLIARKALLSFLKLCTRESLSYPVALSYEHKQEQHASE